MTALLPQRPALLDVEPDEPEPEDRPTPVFKVKSKPELEREGVKAIYRQATGRDYVANAKDLPAWTRMRTKVGIAGIEERWRVGLAAKGWDHVDNLWQLETKWNEHSALLAKSRPAFAEDVYTCDGCGGRQDVNDPVVGHGGRYVLDKLALCWRCTDSRLARGEPGSGG